MAYVGVVDITAVFVDNTVGAVIPVAVIDVLIVDVANVGESWVENEVMSPLKEPHLSGTWCSWVGMHRSGL